ncbi:unnamed protein product [Rhizophagus irregularis]|nr:unnamed protein product [Rhizophagus irregularis]
MGDGQIGQINNMKSGGILEHTNKELKLGQPSINKKKKCSFFIVDCFYLLVYKSATYILYYNRTKKKDWKIVVKMITIHVNFIYTNKKICRISINNMWDMKIMGLEAETNRKNKARHYPINRFSYQKDFWGKLSYYKAENFVKYLSILVFGLQHSTFGPIFYKCLNYND